MTIDKGKEQVLYAYDDVSMMCNHLLWTLDDDPIERSVEPKQGDSKDPRKEANAARQSEYEPCEDGDKHAFLTRQHHPMDTVINEYHYDTFLSSAEYSLHPRKA
jgi:hypothetical protein